MDEKDAKEWLRWFIATGQPVHPQAARKLYKEANIPLPAHLVPVELKYTKTQSDILNKLEQELFKSMGVPSSAFTAECNQSAVNTATVQMEINRILRKFRDIQSPYKEE